MRESERRIKQYNRLLVHLREKVSIVAMLLVISVVMAVMSTFAWVTLSRSPEVKGISTTITANGNLEIALSDVDGLEPDESKVGDSKKDLLSRNLTWGNLVNLSDSSYGLEDIVLRPATLNRSALDTSPLFAAQYSSDGRVENLTSAFAYTNYDSAIGAFLVSDETKYGVRAISSLKYTYADGTQAYYERLNKVNNALGIARSEYENLVSADGPYMEVVCDIIGDYMTARFGDALATTNFGKYTSSMYDMMIAFKGCMDAAGETYLQLANLQLYIKDPMTSNYYTTLDELFASTDSNVTGMTGFSAYKSDYKKLETYITDIEKLKIAYEENGTPVYWSNLSTMVNFMANINSTEVDDMAISSIGADEAAGLVFQGSGKIHSAVIKQGALKDMENRLGTYMYAQGMSVTATAMGLTVTLNANVTTVAMDEQKDEINSAIKAVTEKGNSGGAVATAADTYGMAIDFWVRSNADEDYLILEGGVITDKVQKTDEAGRLYFSNPDTGEILIKDGNTYYDVNGNVVQVDANAYLDIVYETVIVGYEGSNRVWDEVNSDNSVTQGSGSCYVFYSDPTNMDQSLELLEAMRVAFVDDEGTLLALAYFDTQNYFASSGKVTVPLVLSSTSIVAGTDDFGNNIYAITQLMDKEAVRITALVYVDGNVLTNQQVLSSSDIQGQLNIQFGSGSELEPVIDQDLYYGEVSISASVSKDYFDYMDENGVSTEVTLNISGLEPTIVTANFVRKINNSQGTRQDAVSFINSGEGVFSSQATFTAPGTYILRSVFLDGIEYELENEITVTIDGFVVNSVGWNQQNNYVKIMSADSYHSEKIWVEFAGNSLNPSTVKGVFSNNENQQITVNFTNTSTRWEGTAKFSTSGIYTLQYLIIDGEYYEVPAGHIKTIDLSLGMRASVSISETRFDYEGIEKTLSVYVTITDNKGQELTKMENVSLQYMLQGSAMAENGLYTELNWDAGEQRYFGAFTVSKAGAFSFAYLTIDGSSIYTAEAPVIQAIPPETPVYYKNLTEDSTFAAGQNAYMDIAVEFSSFIASYDSVNNTGGMKAVLEKDGYEFEVYGISSAHIFAESEDSTLDVTDWAFKIPTDDDLASSGIVQEGKWSLKKIYIAGAYKDGVFHDEANPLEIDLSSENIVTNVSNEMKVVVSGTDETKKTTFMTAVSAVEGLEVSVQSMDGVVASGVESVSVTYRLDTTSVKTSDGSTAGYTTDSLSVLESYNTVTADLIEIEQGIFGLDTDNRLTFQYAGTYEIESVTFTISGKSYVTYETTDEAVEKVDSDMSSAPSFIVEWEAPVVKFTEVSPSGSITVNGAESDDDEAEQTTVTNKVVNDYEVIANINAVSFGTRYKQGTCNGSNIKSVTSYALPTVYAGILNAGNFSSASLALEPNMDSGGCGGSSGYDAWEGGTFTFTGSTTGYRDGSCVIGSVNRKTDNNGTAYYTRERLGSGIATYITITGGNSNGTIQYVFELENSLTITQEY